MGKYDIDSDVDPLFSVMTSKFNENTIKGMLLNTIPLDLNLNYILESKKEEEQFLIPNIIQKDEDLTTNVAIIIDTNAKMITDPIRSCIAVPAPAILDINAAIS